nr:reverse transcriptase domain-containing protein [Tanacetum cinerariifolium]
MDDKPIGAADCVVASTPGFGITIPESTNEFAIKGNALKLPWSQSIQSNNTDTDKIMAQMDAMTIKIDAEYKQLQSRAKKTMSNLDEDDIHMSREEEAKFMQTFRKSHFYNNYHDRDLNRNNWCSSGRNGYNRDNYRSNTDDKSYDLQKQFNHFMKSQQTTNAFVKETFMDLKTQLKTVAKNHQASIQNLESKFDRLADKQSGQPSGSLLNNTQPNPRDDTCFSVNVIDEILEEDFDALLNEGSKILHSIEGTLLEEEFFFEFDEFISMTADENSESESDTKEPPFEKITINTDYEIKKSLEEPLTDLELKPLPDNLEYVFFEAPSFLPVIISSKLSA